MNAILIRYGKTVSELRMSHGPDGWYISPSMYNKPLFMDRIERNVFKPNHAGVDIGRVFSSYQEALSFATNLANTIKRDYHATVNIDDENTIRSMLTTALFT